MILCLHQSQAGAWKLCLKPNHPTLYKNKYFLVSFIFFKVYYLMKRPYAARWLKVKQEYHRQNPIYMEQIPRKSWTLHRGYSKSNPKKFTCLVNFELRICSKIHRMNHVPVKSTVLKCAALRALLLLEMNTVLTWPRPSSPPKPCMIFKAKRKVPNSYVIYSNKSSDTFV